MLLLILIFLLLLFSLCSAQEKVQLRLVNWAGTDEIAIEERTVEAFERQHPDIDVLYEPNPGRQYEPKILTGLAADSPPDVFLLDSKLILTFTNKKVLLDLMPYVSKLQIDTSQWFPNVLNIARKGSALYAFPKGFTPLMIYYNKKLFRDAGIPYPTSDWTWDDYLRIAKMLTKDIDDDRVPDVYGTTFSNYYYNWIPWIWSAGGDVVSADGMKASGFLNSTKTEEVLQFLINLRIDYKVAPNVGTWVQESKTCALSALFANGKIAMNIDGHWRMPKYVKYMQEGLLDIGVAAFPKHPNGEKVNVMYQSGWCVPVNTKHPEKAVLLASFMAGEIACRIRSVGRLEIPANIKVAEEAVANDPTGMEKVFLDEVPYCRQPWGSIIERFSEIEWIFQDAVDEVMVNNKPMHETMTQYAKRADKALADIRSHEKFEFKPIKEHSEILYFLIAVGMITFFSSLFLYLRSKRKERKIMRTALSFLAPSLLHLVVFIFTPIVFAAYLSTHRWDIVVPDKPFIGIDNFSELFTDSTFWGALKNTFIYSLNVPIAMTISLIIALLLHRGLKGIGVLRTLYFLPSVTSFVAVALVWIWIYHPSFGAANFILSSVGLPPLQWLNSAQTAMISIMIFGIWLSLGYQIVIFLAGLQGIPEVLYEAALIDGANDWQKLKRITLPLLKPTTFFILVTSLIASFQVFTTVYIMTAGGPVRSTDVVVYHIYQSAWEQLRMGYAAAMSWVLFILIMIATWIQFKLMGKEVEYG
ncbi:MAG: extracellular solute-binding protein [Bacteroidota bacterium]|nr:extracellular solute-binding protein [Bacteroidota bacterium]